MNLPTCASARSCFLSPFPTSNITQHWCMKKVFCLKKALKALCSKHKVSGITHKLRHKASNNAKGNKSLWKFLLSSELIKFLLTRLRGIAAESLPDKLCSRCDKASWRNRHGKIKAKERQNCITANTLMWWISWKQKLFFFITQEERLDMISSERRGEASLRWYRMIAEASRTVTTKDDRRT